MNYDKANPPKSLQQQFEELKALLSTPPKSEIEQILEFQKELDDLTEATKKENVDLILDNSTIVLTH